ncbi:hypothetical protein BC826DRAFT_1084058 [Russula brevipes]|nr:hypothetical protein BC826DRAFT_1084058 [Russula brevipes]
MSKRIGMLAQLVPPEPTWTAADVPDQTGKVVIITGGNRGIGKETARELLSKGAKVYIATRSEEKARSTIEDLKQATGKDSIYFIKLDLADLPCVKTAAEEFIGKEPELHTLYNNAGVMYTPVDKVTNQGYDLQFGTNVLGHFYFTKLLLPVLTATAKKCPPKTVRVVNVSSIGHYIGGSEGIRWSTLATGDGSLEERKKLGPAKLYSQSKLGNILFSNELARQCESDGVVSISLNSGTDFTSHASTFVERVVQTMKYAFVYVISCGSLSMLTEETQAIADFTEGTRVGAVATKVSEGTRAVADKVGGSSPSETSNPQGAINSLYAGTAPPAGELNGKYLTAWARVTLPHRKALDSEAEKKLWEWCEERVKDLDNTAAPRISLPAE